MFLVCLMLPDAIRVFSTFGNPMQCCCVFGVSACSIFDAHVQCFLCNHLQYFSVFDMTDCSAFGIFGETVRSVLGCLV